MVEVCNTNLDEMVDSLPSRTGRKGCGFSLPAAAVLEPTLFMWRRLIISAARLSKWTSNLISACPIPASWVPLPAASWTVGTKAMQGQGISDSGRDHAGLF